MTADAAVSSGTPWVPGRASSLVPFKDTLIPLDKWQFREVAIRNP